MGKDGGQSGEVHTPGGLAEIEYGVQIDGSALPRGYLVIIVVVHKGGGITYILGSGRITFG